MSCVNFEIYNKFIYTTFNTKPNVNKTKISNKMLKYTGKNQQELNQ